MFGLADDSYTCSAINSASGCLFNTSIVTCLNSSKLSYAFSSMTANRDINRSFNFFVSLQVANTEHLNSNRRVFDTFVSIKQPSCNNESNFANGGFAEYIAVPEKNVFKIPDNMQWELSAGIPVTTLTPYHALKQAALKIDEFLVIFGASGNTGMMATQFGKKTEAKVIAVSKDNWIKDFGADYIITEYDRVAEKVKDLTQGKMADVVLNSLGVQTWENSFASVGLNGRWVTFGGLTGADVKLDVQSLYSKQIKLIGCNGGTRKEMTEVIDMSKELKTRVWKKFKLDEAKEALEALFAKERDGRILLNVS